MEYGHLLLAEYCKYQDKLTAQRKQEKEEKLNHVKAQMDNLKQQAEKEHQEKIKEQEKLENERKEAERKKIEEEERKKQLQKEREEAYFKKVEDELRQDYLKQQQQEEMHALDKKIRPQVEKKLKKEFGFAGKPVSGNVNTQTLLVALPEIKLESSDKGNSEQSTKRPLDDVSMCTPPSKKIRSLEDFKSVMSPGKGSGRPGRSTPSRVSLFGSPRSQYADRKDENMMAMAGNKIQLMRDVDKFLIAKPPKDKDKKVLFDKLRIMNLYINENSLLVNKNIGLDTFYMAMTSYFPNLGVSVKGNIEKL